MVESYSQNHANKCSIILCQINNKINLHKNLQQIKDICSKFSNADARLIIFPPQLFALPIFNEKYDLDNLLSLIQNLVIDIPILINPFGEHFFLISIDGISKLNNGIKFSDELNYLSLDDILESSLDLCMNCIPFSLDRSESIFNQISSYCIKNNRSVIYLNKIGAEESFIFDGNSCLISSIGVILYQMPALKKQVVTIDLFKDNQASALLKVSSKEETVYGLPLGSMEMIYNVLMIGLRDYVEKNNLKQIIIGLSGGIDSSLTAVLAVDALGSSRVVGMYMPSKYTSKLSDSCTYDLANRLNIKLVEYNIDALVLEMYKSMVFNEANISLVTQENIQARIRALLLMTYSNQYGGIIVTTSNKSELCIGYVSLYGDMCGSYAPLKDIYKTQVYDLSHWRNNNLCHLGLNKNLNLISEQILDRPPTSELSKNCLDIDVLPEYKILDNILKHILHDDILFNPDFELVKKITKMVLKNRFKRLQVPPGPRLYFKENQYYFMYN